MSAIDWMLCILLMFAGGIACTCGFEKCRGYYEGRRSKELKPGFYQTRELS